MVPVTVEHTLDPVHIVLGPFKVVAYEAIVACKPADSVGFDIRLVNNINAVDISKSQEEGVGRIV